MRNNKAVRQNRNFMMLTTILGFMVIGCVLAFWYLAFNNETVAEDSETTNMTDSDSVCEIILLDETVGQLH